MRAVFILRNVVVAAAVVWALFGIWHLLENRAGTDGQGQLSAAAGHIMVAALASLAAFALAELCRFTAGRSPSDGEAGTGRVPGS